MYTQQNYYPSNYNTYPMIAGRIVNDFNEIIPNDIPMDGRNAIFIKSDLSEIQSRRWNQDGRIITIRFSPIVEDKILPEQPKVFDNSEALDALKERVDKLEKALSNSNRQRVRKEGANNE